ncbi:G1 family glutamic endopeptidase [Fodinicola feengrottensis]|uniref:G1 family glutamic endopeptidase n=1 Tax=Fodinicola feengrottensis TaxID=435914 RepID=UPI0031DF4D32
MTRRVFSAAALGIGVFLTLAAGATPAAAAAHPHPADTQVRNHADSAWGGYAIERGGTTVTTTWVNPTVKCAGNVNSVWAGFDGYGTNTVEQIGIDLDCSSGQAQYLPWYEMYPRDSIYFTETTRAGDTMTATVVHNSGTSYTLTLADRTQNWSRTFHDSLSGAQDATAEVIMERLDTHVDNFGSVTFTNCQLDGKSFASYAAQSVVITHGSTQQAKPGALSGGTFKMTWLHI